jgi:AcrR family transcriptional regulator
VRSLTAWIYCVAVSDACDPRMAQKIRTRDRILAAAQRLFAAKGFESVTVNELAASAGVSVQTVFNHFASKEEIFFADRADWVEGPARAVLQRAAGEAPEVALRRHLVAAVVGYARAAGEPDHRRMMQVLENSPGLCSYERSLHDEAVAHLAAALMKAHGCSDDDVTRRPVLAEVLASVWLAPVRTVALDLRTNPPAPGDEQAVAAAGALLDTVLDDLAGVLTMSILDTAPASS